MAELLLELFSEEIPARMQSRAAADLGARLRTMLRDACGLPDGARIRTFVTPRRLAAVVDDVPTVQPDISEERRGPRVGAPEKAVQGFLRSAGLESVADCEQRETGKGRFYYAVTRRGGRPTIEVLAEEIPAMIAEFSWPKSMRWGGSAIRWVRPLHSVLCVLDGEVVPGDLDLAPNGAGSADRLPFSNVTRGHRWLAPGAISVSSFGDYADALAGAHVVLDAAERRRRIADQAERLAGEAGLRVDGADALLDEVAGLVEWPICLIGTFDESFMTVPPEILVTAMKKHQKYLPLRRPDGAPANRFIMVANIEAPDGGEAIRAGNERVLRARLHDAKFFWDKDRGQPLESRLPKLDRIVFHRRLGSVGEKVGRLQRLARTIAAYVPGANLELVDRAARLCKADLVTEMVAEFAELQGVMGKYYARNDGEAEAVAEALAEQYAPAGPSDRCPEAPVSVVLALADKVDNLAGFFAIEERPTGSKDPFALRRAALGVIRLIGDNGLRIPLRTILADAIDAYGALSAGRATSDVADEIMNFIADRLRADMRDRGLRHDMVSAVFTVAGDDDLVRLVRRADALRQFLDTDDGANLLLAYRRAANIVRIEEKKDKATYGGAVDTNRFRQDEERMLHARLERASGTIIDALEAEDFQAAMMALATLRAPIDLFFDQVKVNADDAELRANRLRLLAQIRTSLSSVADFAKIEG